MRAERRLEERTARKGVMKAETPVRREFLIHGTEQLAGGRSISILRRFVYGTLTHVCFPSAPSYPTNVWLLLPTCGHSGCTEILRIFNLPTLVFVV